VAVEAPIFVFLSFAYDGVGQVGRETEGGREERCHGTVQSLGQWSAKGYERVFGGHTSCVEVAKLGDGLARPSILLLLLYGLYGAPRMDWIPLILPRFSVVNRSGGPPRKLRLRAMR
jgi:hypothetical protein